MMLRGLLIQVLKEGEIGFLSASDIISSADLQDVASAMDLLVDTMDNDNNGARDDAGELLQNAWQTAQKRRLLSLSFLVVSSGTHLLFSKFLNFR